MTCHDFVAALSTLDRPTAHLAWHAQGCQDCRRLWQAELHLRTLRPLAPEIAASAELRSLFVGHQGATRATHPLRRLLAVSLAVVASVALAFRFAPRADLHVAPIAALVLPFAAFALLLIAGLHLFSYRGRSGLGVAPWLRWAFALFGVVFFGIVTALQSAPHAPWSSTIEGFRFAPSHDCLPLGLLVAGCVGAVAFWFGRRMALVGAASSGALAGCVAGFSALLFLHVHCAGTIARHLTIAHGLPLLCAIGIGALVGRRVLAA